MQTEHEVDQRRLAGPRQAGQHGDAAGRRRRGWRRAARRVVTIGEADPFSKRSLTLELRHGRIASGMSSWFAASSAISDSRPPWNGASTIDHLLQVGLEACRTRSPIR